LGLTGVAGGNRVGAVRALPVVASGITDADQPWLKCEPTLLRGQPLA
jgi:hypothetical protein